MNCNKFIRGIAMLCMSSLLWVSCQKEIINQDVSIPETKSNLKLSGVVPDDSAAVAKVHIITSADYLADNIRNYFSFQPNAESARGGSSGGKDRTTPVVNITNPVSGTTVSGIVTVQVTASDNVGVSTVVLKLNGAVIGSKNNAPYNFSWNTSGLSSGTYTITATATDASGNSDVSTIQVGYNTPAGSDITPPTVSITSPANGASVTNTITVSVSAADNIGVSSVNFKVDGAAVAVINTAPYNFSWNTTNFAAGVHTLTATAADVAGNTNTHSIQVTVNTTVIPPAPTLPASSQLLMPPIALQGGESSCVAFSVGYAARSAAQLYKTNATSYSYNTNIFSPEFLYNQTKLTDCASGVGVTTALNFLINTGISTWQSMPYSSYNGCSLMPTPAQSSEAAGYKIASYSRIPVSDITTMKTMIVNKKALIVTFAIDQSFSLAQPGFIWKSYSGNPGISHSVAICGYDDSKHAYKIMNSWGTEWGDAGYSWIDYDFLPQASYYYAYVID